MKCFKILSVLFALSGLALSCSSTPKEAPESENPVLPLAVMQWKSAFAHESAAKAYELLGEQREPLLPNSTVLVLAGCTRGGVQKVEYEFLKGFLKYLEDNTKGRVIVGCWDQKNSAMKLNQAAGFQPHWDADKCESFDKKDENGKVWTFPFFLKGPDGLCNVPKIDEIILVSNKSSLGALGPAEGLSGLVPPGQKSQIKTIEDLHQIEQMVPPIAFVAMAAADRAFALSTEILPMDLLQRQLDNKGSFIWFHNTVKAHAEFKGYDLMKPLVRVLLADELSPENYAKFQVAQMALENPVRYKGVPVHEKHLEKPDPTDIEP